MLLSFNHYLQRVSLFGNLDKTCYHSENLSQKKEEEEEIDIILDNDLISLNAAMQYSKKSKRTITTSTSENTIVFMKSISLNQTTLYRKEPCST